MPSSPIQGKGALSGCLSLARMVGVWAGKFILWVAMMSLAWVLTKVVSFADRYGRVGLALSIAGLVSVGALYLFSVGGEGQLEMAQIADSISQDLSRAQPETAIIQQEDEDTTDLAEP